MYEKKLFILNYLHTHETTKLTNFMDNENGNNCSPQLVKSAITPKCNY